MNPRRILGLLAGLALAPWLGACVAFVQEPGVRVATDPPGATILVNGKDTGFQSPTFIDLSGDNARLDMVLEGYQTATRFVRTDDRKDSTHWSEMDLNGDCWRFPLWVDYDDFFGMWKSIDVYEPTRLFVRLRLAGGT